MALENKKLSAYDDLASANIDTTTKLVVLTGATKVNNNLPVTNFIEDSLTSTSVVKPLSAKRGKELQDTKAPIANPTFTGAVNGITKSMVGLGNVDNESKATMFTNPTFTGSVTVPQPTSAFHAVQYGLFDDRVPIPVFNKILIGGDDGTASWGSTIDSPIITGLQTFSDNTEAAALATGTVYKTPTGVLMIKY